MPKPTKNNISKPFITSHGVLVDIRGLGVLICGPSGIGKSDCALELISKGCKLISDDVVEITRSDSGILIGSSPVRTKHLMEIRGIGIVNIKALYGSEAVMNEKHIGMVIELCKWDSDTEYDRLGIDEKTYKLLGVDVPYLRIPITPTRNASTILELAALNQLLKLSDPGNNHRILDQLDDLRKAAGIK